MRIHYRQALAAAVSVVALGAATPALSAGGVEWSYHGDIGPEHWGDLVDSHGDRAYPLCALGTAQSPIDIPAGAAVDARRMPLAFDYRPVPLAVKNNGHTIQVDYAPGSTMTVQGVTYDLLQFHFHAPSEHHVDGDVYPMEGHLVHGRQNGDTLELAVVGFLMTEGEANPVIQGIWEHMPAETGSVTVRGAKVSAADLLPDSREYYGYSGSLTTPPCSEDVKWHVLAEPIEVSERQIAAFEELFEMNARPPQPLNGRLVIESAARPQ
ncbi:MAG: carbonic anhydrase family protein [Inquilinus sp.]|nr:carbonic anhydrase family protein [Inquilinus sp.]